MLFYLQLVSVRIFINLWINGDYWLVSKNAVYSLTIKLPPEGAGEFEVKNIYDSQISRI